MTLRLTPKITIKKEKKNKRKWKLKTLKKKEKETMVENENKIIPGETFSDCLQDYAAYYRHTQKLDQKMNKK